MVSDEVKVSSKSTASTEKAQAVREDEEALRAFPDMTSGGARDEDEERQPVLLPQVGGAQYFHNM